MSENRNQNKAIKFVEKFYYSNCVNSAPLKEGKQGKCMILVDAQRTEIPYTYMTGKSLQINIVVDSYSKFYSAKITLEVKTNLIT